MTTPTPKPFTLVEKKNRKGKNAPKPKTPKAAPAARAEEQPATRLFECDKCSYSGLVLRFAGEHPKFRYTCPWAATHEFRVTSYSQAQELLCTQKQYAEVDPKNYRARKACEFLWKFDQSDRPASLAVVDGSYTRGIKDAGDRMLWRTHLQLSAAQLKALQETHPSYWFVTGTTHHDHPIAHINTQIASRGLIARIVKAGGSWLDLHGNPAANAKTNVRHPNVKMYTMVELCTPKDHIRAATKWGNWTQDPLVFQSAMRDISVDPTEDRRTLLGGLSGAISIHTLYYYERKEIAALMGHMKGKPLHALVHRFVGNSGTLCNGEMTFERKAGSFGDRITQTNKDTGESYEHPDNEWLFQGASSWHNDRDGFGWTISAAGVDTYLVTIVHTPPPACRMDPLASNGKKLSHVVNETVSVVLPTDQTPTEFDSVCHTTARYMVAHVSGKARTSAQFKDHLAATKRAMKKNGSLDNKSVTQTAVFSFVKEMESDKEVLRVIGDLKGESKAIARSLGTGTVIDEMNVLSKVFTVAATLSDGKKLSSCFRMASALSRTEGESLE